MPMPQMTIIAMYVGSGGTADRIQRHSRPYRPHHGLDRCARSSGHALPSREKQMMTVSF